MTLKERLEIVKEYHKWFEETNGKNDFDLLDCPETLMAFLQSRGLLNDRPKGEWKVKTISTFIQYQPNEYVCPFCNTIVNYKTNFCPNCGADMRGERNGKD